MIELAVATLAAIIFLASPGVTTEVFVPSRLLIRMQKALLQSPTLIQTVDFDEVLLKQPDVHQRFMIGGLCAHCSGRMGQGKRVEMLNGLGDIFIYNRFEITSEGKRSFLAMSVIVEGMNETVFMDLTTGKSVSFKVEDLNDSDSVSAQVVHVTTPSDGSTYVPIQIPSSFFQESMTVTGIAETCTTVGGNTRDNRPIRSLSKTTRSVGVNVTNHKNLVSSLPYASIPTITTLLNLYLSSGVITLQFVSLMLLFVDLENIHQLKSAKGVPRWVYVNINLVWIGSIILGSFTIYDFYQVQGSVDSTWVGCGTWSMIMVADGFLGRYRCQVIALTESNAWYAYLFYAVPAGVMIIITVVTLFAQWQRHKYGLERGLRRHSFPFRSSAAPSNLDGAISESSAGYALDNQVSHTFEEESLDEDGKNPSHKV
uniref:Uncharacterized protein n=1 Tax=Compsopogon caeruleus TaxID=31354 RepID=A0A7S1X9A6_9RHOD|mmetsp:Transcript_1056/g.2254  ORF Transcript_1056/g.2254 Transcript_1056/m.2254 type:complete len:427 (+) Transcript_1056:144-1424(+)|eukprot:CAMPEP_0184689280 /NCGR_PEP_ID=MMETSP0312-20130426/30567_1 /TAXON_ID=31354 /ORGANISM="Compsopogon coeruleus, Strain SAG 36.94" /LENGTH=426 /DNA_ID=CAMNT_0027146611 /DNA_START=127 /DNA_END=1407 /DNA_ORIENTATION=-